MLGVFLFLAVVLVLCDGTLSRRSVHECDPHIEQLFLGFRHGARATYLYLPDDPNNDFFTVGPAQLTQTGLRQMYASGETVRNRYAGFLRVPYMPNDVRIRSTLYDRTMMSASAFAAALFRPSEDETWLRGLNWQPAAIYTTKHLLAIDPTNSDTMRNVLKALIESDQQLRTTVIEIEKATDIGHKELFKEFFYVVENFKTEMFYNLTLPYGLDDQKHEVEDLLNKLIIGSYSRPEVFCLNAPSVLNDIVRQTGDYITGAAKQYLNIYSLHDGHVSSILAALTDDGMAEMTPFAATFFIEIHQNATCNGHNVKLLYRTNVTDDPREVEIRGCRRPCSWSQFRRIVERILRMCKYDTSIRLEDEAVTSNEPDQEKSVDASLVSGPAQMVTASGHIERPSMEYLMTQLVIVIFIVCQWGVRAC